MFGVQLVLGGETYGGCDAALGGERIAVDDQRDPAVGQRCASGHGLAVGDDRRERPGDELTLADQVVDGEREAPVLGRG